MRLSSTRAALVADILRVPEKAVTCRTARGVRLSERAAVHSTNEKRHASRDDACTTLGQGEPPPGPTSASRGMNRCSSDICMKVRRYQSVDSFPKNNPSRYDTLPNPSPRTHVCSLPCLHLHQCAAQAPAGAQWRPCLSESRKGGAGGTEAALAHTQ